MEEDLSKQKAAFAEKKRQKEEEQAQFDASMAQGLREAESEHAAEEQKIASVVATPPALTTPSVTTPRDS
jgi:hypothetical protein